MPPMVAAAGVMAAGSMATGIASAAMAPGQSSGRFKLPSPEEEAAYLKRTEANLKAIDADTVSLQEDMTAMKERLATARGVIEGTIPDEVAMKAFQKFTNSMLEKYGSEDAIKRGLLDEASAAELEAGREMEKTGYTDEEMKLAYADERKRYEANLRSNGLSPSQIQNAMNRFDGEARSKLATRAEELRTAATGRMATRISSGLAARQQGLSEYLGLTGSIREGGAALTNLATTEAGAMREYYSTRSGLRGEATSIYEDMGQFDFSKEGKDMLEAGLVGPGTVYDQTGISRNEVGHYKDIKRGVENDIVDPYLHSQQNYAAAGRYPGKGSNEEYFDVTNIPNRTGRTRAARGLSGYSQYS